MKVAMIFRISYRERMDFIKFNRVVESPFLLSVYSGMELALPVFKRGQPERYHSTETGMNIKKDFDRSVCVK